MLRKLAYTLLALALLAVAGFFIFAPGLTENAQNRVAEHEGWPVSAEAQRLHDSLTIADWHADSLLWDRDLAERSESSPP